MAINMILERKLLMREAMNDKNMLMALRYSFTKDFYNMMTEFAGNKQNIIISIYGKQGFGKSIIAFYLAVLWAKLTGSKFDITHIAFTNQEALELLKNAKAGDIYIIDEQVEIVGEGSERERMALENIEATVRASQISLLYCSPKLKLHANHYILRATGLINKKKSTNMCILLDGMNEKPVGHVITGYPNMSDDFWYQYNKFKMNFIKLVLNQEPVDRNKEYESIAEDFFQNHIKKDKLIFSKKKALIAKMITLYKKNYTNDEWITINILVDEKCRNENISPYRFATW